MAAEKTRIQLEIKEQLKEARDEKDDWTGKTSAKERRRAQNRLHQRTWRRRKLEEAQSRLQQRKIVSIAHAYTVNDDALESAFAAATASFFPATFAHSHGSSEPQKSSSPYHNRCINPSSKTPANLNSLLPLSPAQAEKPTARTLPNIISQKPIPPLLPFPHLLPQNTTCTILFPLSPDHRLITLIQYNVMRALLLNFHLCNVLSTLPSSCKNLLALPPLPHTLPATPPPSFTWTEVQKSVRHKDWIDTLPCARMRDNLILAAPSSSLHPRTINSPSPFSAVIATLLGGEAWESRRLFDEDELCSDTCGGLYEGFDDCATRGMLVWGDPWEVQNWEVSEGFAKKWGWLLNGCGEVIEATNRWRGARGEEPIVVEV